MKADTAIPSPMINIRLTVKLFDACVRITRYVYNRHQSSDQKMFSYRKLIAQIEICKRRAHDKCDSECIIRILQQQIVLTRSQRRYCRHVRYKSETCSRGRRARLRRFSTIQRSDKKYMGNISYHRQSSVPDTESLQDGLR